MLSSVGIFVAKTTSTKGEFLKALELTVVLAPLNTTRLSLGQFAKASSFTLIRFGGKTTLSRELLPAKADAAMLVMLLPNSTKLRLVQFANAAKPTDAFAFENCKVSIGNNS